MSKNQLFYALLVVASVAILALTAWEAVSARNVIATTQAVQTSGYYLRHPAPGQK